MGSFTKKKISKNWHKISKIYLEFADSGTDRSEEAQYQMYLWESFGEGQLKESLFIDRTPNAYANGKKWMDVTIKMYEESLTEGSLKIHELYQCYDSSYHWWLDKISKKWTHNARI